MAALYDAFWVGFCMRKEGKKQWNGNKTEWKHIYFYGEKEIISPSNKFPLIHDLQIDNRKKNWKTRENTREEKYEK